MKTILILKGLPASGKSTYAKELVAKQPGSWKRINKDDLRAMLDLSHHSKGNEKFVLKTRDWLITQALEDGKHVVIDDTNLAPKHEARIRNLAKEYTNTSGSQITVKVKFFDVELEECIRRDLNRPKSVGEKAIRKMWKQYIANEKSEREVHYMEQDPTLPKAIICDLDGTLCLMNGRNPFDASKCDEDLVNQPVYTVVKNYQQLGYKIILLSGRVDTYKPQTLAWLEKHAVDYDMLVMRKAKDQRKDSIVKKEFFDNEIRGKFFIEFVLDDRNQVVDMWRKELGLACLQVNYGDF